MLNAYNRTHARFEVKTGSEWIVPDDFNRTSTVLEPWDHRITDNDISRLLRMIYSPRPTREFASYFDTGEDFIYFSPPFSRVAREEFGYAPFDCHLLNNTNSKNSSKDAPSAA